ncbi:MAG: ABC transporter ATP-binding protein [Armatimonadota bacterium]|nr:ABC transporter ATP-binding protein [Armatimonadota bacterium]
MIAIRALRKAFGAFTALENISAEIADGAFALLLGSNGAGKTTLLRCVLGLCSFDGSIAVGPHDVAADGQRARHLVGYVPQRPTLPDDLTCAEVLDLFGRLRGLRRGDVTWLARVGLAGRERAPVRTLSGGLRQRLALAVALQHDPPVLLFDEPAASLDVAARRALHHDLAEFARGGRTVVLATHLAAEPLQAATQALVLHGGRLVYDGAPDRLGRVVRQRVVFALNGTGRDRLRAALAEMPDVQLSETSGAVAATTRPGGAFDLVAAVAAAGVRPLEVHVEEPAIEPARLLDGAEGGAV